MLSTLDGRVAKLDGSMGDVKVTFEKVDGRYSVGLEGIDRGVQYLQSYFRSTNERRCGIAIETWDEFHREFKAQFYPEYVEDETQAKLRQFTQ
ncbi:hypothetical protein J1N35_026715 [Gossypium stocksii]|uniref:Retrotransposon gag domain-containing protein n=1 Tax=Gossypium stocksii TaxID=47602 RepID=A0A9D3ZYF6_9ROSI|nr:hypothetical protein J1N35_026715 [Gossypium stocksii]